MSGSGIKELTGDFPIAFDTLAGRVVLTALHVIAILLTLLRLAHRIRIRRISWDDGLALSASILQGLYMGEEWKRHHLVQRKNSTDSAVYYHNLYTIFRSTIAYALGIIWLCRASLAFFYTRILPNGRGRTFSMILSVGCILYGTTLVTLKQLTCTSLELATGRPMLLICKPKGLGIWAIQMAGDIVSSFLLLLLPLHALYYKLNSLPKCERNLLVVLTSSTIFPLITCLMYNVFAYQKDAFKLALTMKVMVSLSLSVCSLTIVVTAIYQVFRHREGDDSSGSSVIDSQSSDAPATQTNSTKAPASSDLELTQISTTEVSVIHSTPPNPLNPQPSGADHDLEKGRR